MTGTRDADTAKAFIKDLAARLRGHVQVTTDGLRAYVAPLAQAFSKMQGSFARCAMGRGGSSFRGRTRPGLSARR